MNSDKFLSPFYPYIFKTSHFPLLFFFCLWSNYLIFFQIDTCPQTSFQVKFSCFTPRILFSNFYHILFFPSPSLLSLSYIRFSLSNLGCATASCLFFPSLVLLPLEPHSIYNLRNLVQVKILPHNSPKVLPVAYRVSGLVQHKIIPVHPSSDFPPQSHLPPSLIF